MINKKAGKLMREIRKKHNISMIDLANAIQVSQPRLSRIENGQEIQLTVIADFCKYFDIPLSSFFKSIEFEDKESKSLVIDDQLSEMISSLNEEQKVAMYTFVTSLRK
ncbi:helix-turn-helix domain-containing protein [Bacillus tuaregi]|uniref:helix-turn-helix domain-containing protein n=1 Tax=Bacillus tuaregi TaxID=1816695 RepID=UPI0008F90F36|nr:helix-turn-helix transcriptional regulator [Bacillus tuaregi]